MKKLFIVIGETKDVENDNGKEICQFVADKHETLFRGTAKLAMLSDKKKKRIATVLEEMLIPLLKLNDEDHTSDANDNLKDEVIDVKNLDETEIQYVFETCINYVETFAKSVGWDDDLRKIEELLNKATVKKVVVPAGATFN